METRPEAEDRYARLFVAAPKLLQRCRMALADAEAAIEDPASVAGYNWKSIAEDLRSVITAAA